MQAIELIKSDDTWCTLVILFVIAMLAILKLINANELHNYTTAFFTVGFFKKKNTENSPILTYSNMVFFVLGVTTLSLFCYEILEHFNGPLQGFISFFKISLAILIIYVLKYFVDICLMKILGIQEYLDYFSRLKYGYLVTLALWMLPALIVYQYTYSNITFLLVYFGLLLGCRTFLIFINNKRLLISKLFYFILYFCTLEIAPLLLLYKTTTT
ncbi:DUF4271 domain-containing protein [Tenacibaculum sp. SG-28]|uniref:DUF4271 domain-containing protein n=1 Tax=Tenacibaculum sp. SG-28 TaxID=754426 RepID=UPI000CF563B2|nr:DUF4271 domain-containing protein [Tenacibaculum sp. SG-28]PQJ21709.1 hypothetical protein BSU00_06410 [Tenacibaculum sp. SG-28]